MTLLITSPYFKNNSNKKILSLSKCLLNKKYLLENNVEFINHHWVDNNIMLQDVEYIKTTYEDILDELKTNLNIIHNLNWKKRSWRILIGPWLLKFIAITFDRWKYIHILEKEHKISAAFINQANSEDLRSSSYEELSRLSKDNYWNKILFDYFISKSKKIPHTATKYKNLKIKKEERFLMKIKIKYLLKNVLFSDNIINLLRFLKKNESIVYSSTYLSKVDLLKLKLKNNSILIDDFTSSIKYSKERLNVKKRKEIFNLNQKKDCFKTLLYELLITNIPRIYIEDFDYLIYLSNKSVLPHNPKLILTGSSLWHDEVFKAYTASRINNGSKLAIMQHGGFYGTSLYSVFEDHEEKISDKYLVWGWAEKSKHFNIDIQFKNIRRKQKVNSNKILLITHNFIDSNFMTSMSTNELFDDRAYKYEEFFHFLLKKIGPIFINRIKVRLFPGKNNINKELILTMKRYGISISQEISFINEINNSLLSIFCYSGTPFLESISLNKPSILYISEDIDPFREKAKVHFNKLKKVGIFHTSYKSLIEHLLHVENNIYDWWNSEPVKKTKENFCKNYAPYSHNKIKKINNLIKEIL